MPADGQPHVTTDIAVATGDPTPICRGSTTPSEGPPPASRPTLHGGSVYGRGPGFRPCRGALRSPTCQCDSSNRHLSRLGSRRAPADLAAVEAKVGRAEGVNRPCDSAAAQPGPGSDRGWPASCRSRAGTGLGRRRGGTVSARSGNRSNSACSRTWPSIFASAAPTQ